jgi:hypothetical protein
LRGLSLFFAILPEIWMRAMMASREAEGKQMDLPDEAAPDIVSFGKACAIPAGRIF